VPDLTLCLLCLALLSPSVPRQLTEYFSGIRDRAPWLEPYRPQGEGDFSGLLRYLQENKEGLNNLATQLLG